MKVAYFESISDQSIALLLGTYFLINWLNEGEENLFDVVASKSVVPPDGVDILDVSINTECRVSFSGQFYKARVVDYGE